MKPTKTGEFLKDAYIETALCMFLPLITDLQFLLPDKNSDDKRAKSIAIGILLLPYDLALMGVTVPLGVIALSAITAGGLIALPIEKTHELFRNLHLKEHDSFSKTSGSTHLIYNNLNIKTKELKPNQSNLSQGHDQISQKFKKCDKKHLLSGLRARVYNKKFSLITPADARAPNHYSDLSHHIPGRK